MKASAIFSLGVGAGIAFTLSGVFALGYWVTWKQEGIETEMRWHSCRQSSDEAGAFVSSDLSPILKAARSNEPPSAVAGHVAVSTRVTRLRTQLAACLPTEVTVPATHTTLAARLAKQHELFSRLDRYFFMWQMQAPQDIPEGTDLLHRMDDLRRQLTSAS